MVPAGNKAKRLSSVNYTTKTIHDHDHDHHHHHHHHHHHRMSKLDSENLSSVIIFLVQKLNRLRNSLLFYTNLACVSIVNHGQSKGI